MGTNLPTPILIVVIIMVVAGVFFAVKSYRETHKDNKTENKDSENKGE